MTVMLMFLSAFSVFFCLEVLKNVLLTFLIYYFLCCLGIPVISLLVVKKRKLSDLPASVGFTPPGRGQLALGIIHGLLIYAAMLAAYFILRDKVDLNAVMKSVSGWGMPRSGKLLIFVIMVIFNGLVEEVFWRGYCIGRLLPAMKAVPAVILVSLFYTSYHTVTILSFFGVTVLGVTLVLVVLSAGLIWGWMRVKGSQTLWAPAIGHMLATAGYMTIFLLI
jgi:uncharacterized protein